MTLGLSRVSLSPREFALLAEVFRQKAGLNFDRISSFTFERRLGERLEELGLATFHEYYKLLRFGANSEEELSRALELVTTAESYFFRQDYQLRGFSTEVLPEIYQRNKDSKRLVIWSAGCSTGEEVCTLAILVRESGLFEGWDVRVIGSDLSRSRVAFARKGEYSESSFRVTSKRQRRLYFENVGASWRVRDEVRRMCQFCQVNLIRAEDVSRIGRVDIAFCRNVLIYFDQQARTTVIEHLRQRLLPGGYLFLGHSESLLNVTTAFELVHLREDLVYQKPGWRREREP